MFLGSSSKASHHQSQTQKQTRFNPLLFHTLSTLTKATMTAQPHPFFNPAQAAAFNELATKTDSHFEIKYFAFHGLAHVSRTILAAANANFTNAIPIDFSQEKPSTPFGVIPILKETSADGKTVLQVSESHAIERYLSKKFGFLGKDIFEETLVNQYLSNTNGAIQQVYIKYFAQKNPELKKEALDQLIKGPFSDWARHSEQHLIANGSNGHYVGDKTTLADIAAASLIWVIRGISGDDVLSEEKTPAILKVKAAVDDLPGVQAWYKTQDFEDFATNTFNGLGFR